MSRCVILSACPVQPELKHLLRSDDFIIACDAGYRNCVRLGCKPDIIVGDFDSAPCPQQDTDDIVVLPHVKDDTDTEYAAKLASEKGFSEVLLLGALFAVSLGVLFVAFRAVLAPELVRHILLTAAPWYAAGIAAYLLAAWICLEPTWRRRLLYGAVAACVLRLFFLAPAPEAYDGFLPWLTLCTLCTASWSWWSVVRFKEGRQD